MEKAEKRKSVKGTFQQFLTSIIMPMHAERNIVLANLSVCPSICVPHTGIVSKQMHIGSNSFHYLVGT